MVRTVHTNHFYEILAQMSDPKIEFLTKTHFLKNDHVQNFWKFTFWPEKSPCGVVPQQNKGCKHFPDHSRPNSDQIISKNSYFYNNFCENRGFSMKIDKRIKIVAKAKLGIPTWKKHRRGAQQEWSSSQLRAEALPYCGLHLFQGTLHSSASLETPEQKYQQPPQRA